MFDDQAKHIHMRLPSVDFAVERVKLRVAQGGHNVPEGDIKRRFNRSWLVIAAGAKAQGSELKIFRI